MRKLTPSIDIFHSNYFRTKYSSIKLSDSQALTGILNNELLNLSYSNFKSRLVYSAMQKSSEQNVDNSSDANIKKAI